MIFLKITTENIPPFSLVRVQVLFGDIIIMYRSGAVMAWNVFKFCTALRGLGSIMILLVLGVVGVTYYAVVITNYGPGLAAGGLDSLIAFVVLILFHLLVISA